MEKEKIPTKVWLFLISSIICFAVGVLLFGQYSIEVSNIRSGILDELKNTPENETAYYDYTTKSGELYSLFITESGLENDDFITNIMNNIHGKNWVLFHNRFGKILIAVAIMLLVIFVIQLLKYTEGDALISILKGPSIGAIIGCLVCCLGIRTMGISGVEAQRYDGDPQFQGGLLLIIGIGILGFVIYIASKAISRYRLAKYSPGEYRKMVANEKAQALANEKAHQAMLDAERDAAINGTHGAPWETHYLPYPCPYCNRYKVRYIKWEDKRASVAFWGGLSTKIGTNYICDNCKKTWE